MFKLMKIRMKISYMALEKRLTIIELFMSAILQELRDHAIKVRDDI